MKISTDQLTLAIDARREIFASSLETTNAFRLVHGAFDGCPGWTIDVLATVLNARVDPEMCDDPDEIVSVVRHILTLEFPRTNAAWIVIDEPRKDTARTFDGLEEACNERLRTAGLFPTDPEWEIREQGRRYLVRNDSGFSYGIFLDMRQVRTDLAARWSGRKVANLFAYTCAFSVALSPHNEVWNVDVSKPYLAWGRRNHEANGYEGSAKFFRKDAFDFLEFAVSRDIAYDAIILDPPVFSHGKKGLSRRFQVSEDFESLVTLGLRALAPDGEVFISTNFDALDVGAFRSRVSQVAKSFGRRIEREWPIPRDFPATREEFHLKTALIV